MESNMEILVGFLVALALLAILANRFGADSREIDPKRPDW
jgi:hypothetical protein